MCAIDYVRSKSAEALFHKYGVKVVIDEPVDIVNFPMKPRTIIREDSAGVRGLSEANWGLVPFWAKDTKIGRNAFNCRDDSLASGKPMFKSAFERRRCLLIATSYVEYTRVDGKAVPVEFLLDGGEPFAYAGLWETWGKGADYMESCSMVTVEPNEVVAEVHNRMPAILDPEDYEGWLSAHASPDQLFALLRTVRADRMSYRPTVLPPREPAKSKPMSGGQESLF